jgi:hypothetical protein
MIPDDANARPTESALSRTGHFLGRICRGWLFLALIVVLAGEAFWAGAQFQPPIDMKKFTLARVRFTSGLSGWFGGRGRRGRGGGAPWAHDYPSSERNFMKILAEVTKLDVNSDGHIVSFDSEDIFKFPIAYICEVGYLDMSETEVQNMREYLLRGGFLIVDDFRGERDLYNFVQQMKMVFPDRSLELIPKDHSIFNCFYDISDLKLPPPPTYRYEYLNPQYYGMSDDKDRLMMVVNYDTDIGDYWEWSHDPFWPISETNEAYKYGVNYVMYALSH